MAKLIVDQEVRTEITKNPGVLMIHKQPPAMVVIIDKMSEEHPGDFFGTCLETGIHTEYQGHEFDIFRGTLKLEQ